ncbi:MAG TPA: ABC transporter permease [Thermoanaerobaculia bacterium]|nr:ABC transporter permease [Thermoanaerobaculia bacterium]
MRNAERPEASLRETVIRPASGWFDLHLGELWRYRDLIYLMVRRDFVAQYAQTILGPLWFLIQPVLTTAMFVLVFNRVARLPTDGVPPYLFYMAGSVAWGYFANCLTRISTTFTTNAHIFGKVWFPRLVVPISVAVSSLFAFVIQFALLAVLLGLEALRGGSLSFGSGLLLLPLVVLQMGLLGIGCGIVISSLTTKYRDLVNLVAFGVQLWMFATPVVYPASKIPARWAWLLAVNPMAPMVESFRILVLGAGTVTAGQIAAGIAITLLILAAGVVLFSRIEKSFMDTV